MSQLKSIKINTPTYREIIPSSKKEIFIKPFKVADEKVLLMAAESQDPVQLADSLINVISNCIEGEDVSNLASYDMEYLFLKIRSKSVGETAKLSTKCSECETATPFEIDLQDLKVVGVDNYETVIKVTSDLTIEMKQPALQDMLKLTSEDPDGVMRYIANSVKNVFYGEEVFNINTEEEVNDLIEILDQLTTEQFSPIQQYILNVPKVVKDTTAECPHCGHINNVKLEGLADFF